MDSKFSEMDSVRHQIELLAKVDATVFIQGGTESGQEVAARAIHNLSHRKGRAFVSCTCKAITDSKTVSQSLLGQADGGTLFLDRVDALNLKAQAILLQFFQDRVSHRVGGNNLEHADVRLIVASSVDLHSLTEQRRFRQDLLYCINVLSLQIPSSQP